MFFRREIPAPTQTNQPLPTSSTPTSLREGNPQHQIHAKSKVQFGVILQLKLKYKENLIPIKIQAPLNLASLIYAPLIFAHPQISYASNFCTPLFYCKVCHFLISLWHFFFSLYFRTFVLRELTLFNFCAGQMREN